MRELIERLRARAQQLREGREIYFGSIDDRVYVADDETAELLEEAARLLEEGLAQKQNAT